MDNELAGFLAAIGGTANTKKKPKLAPGGLSSARPAPSKISGKDGISDSAFIQQVIQAAEQIGLGQQGLLSTGTQGMGQPPMPGQMQPGQPQQPQQPPQGGGGLADMLSMLGGGGQ